MNLSCEDVPGWFDLTSFQQMYYRNVVLTMNELDLNFLEGIGIKNVTNASNLKSKFYSFACKVHGK